MVYIYNINNKKNKISYGIKTEKKLLGIKYYPIKINCEKKNNNNHARRIGEIGKI